MTARLAGIFRQRWLIIVLAAAIAAAALSASLWQGRAPIRMPLAGLSDGTLRASGTIQAGGVNIASEYGGRIAELPVAEGDSVSAGQVLVRIDAELLDAEIEAGEAALAVAQARLAQAQAGSPPGKVAIAEAQLAQARAARDAAQQAANTAQAMVDNPQEIDLRIAVLEAQQASMEHQLAAAVARKDAFEEAMDRGWGLASTLESFPVTFLSNTSEALRLSYIPYWQGWIGVNSTAEGLQGLQASLANLRAQRENPQELVNQRDQAVASLAQAEAQVRAAEAQVEGLKIGAGPEQLASVQARVAQAQAALDALRRQRAMRDISAPVEGTVVDIVSHPGEVVAAGATILTIANLGEVTLRVYVPEAEIGRVRLGQEAQVTVDGLPGQVFVGQVIHIASRAEFTPRNVATQEERANLVFAVEIRIANAGALKAGMPADAVFVGD